MGSAHPVGCGSSAVFAGDRAVPDATGHRVLNPRLVSGRSSVDPPVPDPQLSLLDTSGVGRGGTL